MRHCEQTGFEWQSIVISFNKNKIINLMFGSSFVTSTISLVTRAMHSNRRGFVIVSVTVGQKKLFYTK